MTRSTLLKFGRRVLDGISVIANAVAGRAKILDI
jgi:hypothetical protein